MEATKSFLILGNGFDISLNPRMNLNGQIELLLNNGDKFEKKFEAFIDANSDVFKGEVAGSIAREVTRKLRTNSPKESNFEAYYSALASYISLYVQGEKYSSFSHDELLELKLLIEKFFLSLIEEEAIKTLQNIPQSRSKEIYSVLKDRYQFVITLNYSHVLEYIENDVFGEKRRLDTVGIVHNHGCFSNEYCQKFERFHHGSKTDPLLLEGVKPNKLIEQKEWVGVKNADAIHIDIFGWSVTGDDAILRDVIDLYCQRGDELKTITIRYFYYAKTDAQEFQKALGHCLETYNHSLISKEEIKKSGKKLPITFAGIKLNNDLPIDYPQMAEQLRNGQMLIISDQWAVQGFANLRFLVQDIRSEVVDNAINIQFLKAQDFYR